MLDTHTTSVADTTYQTAGSGDLPTVTLVRLSSPLATFRSDGSDASAKLVREDHAITTWYVARVRPDEREVRRAQEHLWKQGYHTYHPRFIDAGRRGDVLKPYFPGYLLFGVEDGDTWTRWHGGAVISVLGNRYTGRAIEIPPTTMDAWRDRCGPLGIHDPKPRGQPVRKLDPNTPVVVMRDDGPFAGLPALVRLDDGDRVQVLMDILGGERVVELPKTRVVAA